MWMIALLVLLVLVVLTLLNGKQGGIASGSIGFPYQSAGLGNSARQGAQARDDLLAKLCEAINLPLLTISANPAYPAQELQAQFLLVITR